MHMDEALCRDLNACPKDNPERAMYELYDGTQFRTYTGLPSSETPIDCMDDFPSRRIAR